MVRGEQKCLFSIPFKPRIPTSFTSMFQVVQSWWRISFGSEIMSLLGIAGLGVLVIFCHFWHNLVCLEKTLFDSDCYGTVYDVGSKLCSCISTFLPPESTCRPSYNYWPPWCQRSLRSCSSGSFNSRRHRPEDERRNKSGIHNRQGQYRYFRNKYKRANCARDRRSNLGHSDKNPTSDNQPSTPTPTSPSLHSTWRHSSCFMFFFRLYYGYTAKYYSWMRKRRRRWPKPPDDLEY